MKIIIRHDSIYKFAYMNVLLLVSLKNISITCYNNENAKYMYFVKKKCTYNFNQNILYQN